MGRNKMRRDDPELNSLRQELRMIEYKLERLKFFNYFLRKRLRIRHQEKMTKLKERLNANANK
jgi:hypothetical protein